jgi:hypothetical protein
MQPGLKAFDAAATACVLDGARIEGLPATLQSLQADAASLYNGPTAEQLADVAPYLAPCAPGSRLNRWLFDTAWGQSAGIVVLSESDPDALRAHFRRFLMVLDESGKSLYFRFYDPRVLRVFLPTCDAEQLKSFFGPVTAFVLEDEDPARALRFTLAGGDLVTETIELNKEVTPPRPVIEWKGWKR